MPVRLSPAWPARLYSLVLAAIALFTTGVEVPALAQSRESVEARPLPVDVFFGPSQLGAVELSPSGRWLAVTVQPVGGRIGLAIYDLHGGQPPQEIVRFADMDVGDFEWVGDDRLVFDLLDTHRGSGDQRLDSGLFSVHRDGSDLVQHILMQWWHNPGRGTKASRRLDAMHVFLHVPANQTPGAESVIVRGPRHQDLPGSERVLKRLNIVTGEVQVLNVAEPARGRRWLFDSNGEPLYVVTTRNGETTIFERQRDDQGRLVRDWKPILNHGPLDAPWEPYAVDRSGRLYVTESSGANGEAVLKRYDRARGAPDAQPLVAVPGFDFLGRLVVADGPDGTAELLGVRALTDASTTIWLDPGMAALQRTVDARLPDRVNVVRCSRCRHSDRTVVVISTSDRHPGEFWLLRGEPESPTVWRRIGVRRPAVDPRRMADVAFTRIKARDGLEIPLWATIPEAARSAPAPAVVLVHGGPWTRGGVWAWQPMQQFLASRGYVVIEPEFRGSTGYGRKLYDAGRRQWGRAMQDDLADAVAWTVARGLVDPKRVCIAGGSYGGYATLMGLATQGDIFRCGAAWVPLTDLDWLLTDGALDDFAGPMRTTVLPALVGEAQGNADMVRQVSPLQLVDRIRAPLLLAWGEEDTRIPPKQARELQERLQTAGRPPEAVGYKGEGHSWLKIETRIDFALRLEAFLKRSLAATATP